MLFKYNCTYKDFNTLYIFIILFIFYGELKIIKKNLNYNKQPKIFYTTLFQYFLQYTKSYKLFKNNFFNIIFFKSFYWLVSGKTIKILIKHNSIIFIKNKSIYKVNSTIKFFLEKPLLYTVDNSLNLTKLLTNQKSKKIFINYLYYLQNLSKIFIIQTII